MSRASFYIKIFITFISRGRESHLCHSVCMEGRRHLQESVPSFHQVSPRYELRWSSLAASASEPSQLPSFYVFEATLRKCECVHVALAVFQLDDKGLDLSAITRALSEY